MRKFDACKYHFSHTCPLVQDAFTLASSLALDNLSTIESDLDGSSLLQRLTLTRYFDIEGLKPAQ